MAKFPDDSGGSWGKTIIETVVWMMHLFGGAIWIGGLAGLLAAVELLLGLAVLFAAPFLHGSARNQAFQAQPSVYQSAPAGSLPKIPPKQASASTWIEGMAETIAVAAIMIAGYRFSGRLAKRRVGTVVAPASGEPDDLIGV